MRSAGLHVRAEAGTVARAMSARQLYMSERDLSNSPVPALMNKTLSALGL